MDTDVARRLTCSHGSADNHLLIAIPRDATDSQSKL
jgi:hypothetical protein